MHQPTQLKGIAVTRVAALAEIHGNAASLEAVLASIWSARVDRLLISGGLTFGGPDPATALDLVRELEEDGAVVVSGASDLAVADFDYAMLGSVSRETRRAAAEWTHEALGPERCDWMRRLPSERRLWLGDILLLIAQRPGEAIVPSEPARAGTGFGTDATVICRAGTHVPEVRRIGSRIIVNPGSVGLSSDPRGATWALIEVNGAEVRTEIIPVPFDFNTTADTISARGLPGDEERAELLRGGRAG